MHSGVKPSCSYHPALTSTFCQYCAKYLAFLFFWNNLKSFRHCVCIVLYKLCNGKGNGTPLQYFCLEIPMDGGAWWTAVHGVAGVRHD